MRDLDYHSFRDELNVSLERLGLARERFIVIVDKFVSTYGNSAEKINLLLLNQDIENIQILVHSIKGAAFSIGAKSLAISAEALEEKIQISSIQSKDLDEFYGELSKAVIWIDIYSNDYSTRQE